MVSFSHISAVRLQIVLLQYFLSQLNPELYVLLIQFTPNIYNSDALCFKQIVFSPLSLTSIECESSFFFHFVSFNMSWIDGRRHWLHEFGLFKVIGAETWASNKLTASKWLDHSLAFSSLCSLANLNNWLRIREKTTQAMTRIRTVIHRLITIVK